MAVARFLLTISGLISVISLQAVYGAGIVCEKLPGEICAFSVSSSGARCLLHKSCILRDGDVQYECQASEVMAESMKESIETEECVKACGVERMTMGMSAESLAEGGFTEKLCSPGCYNNCSNIIDLYFNLAAGKESSPKLIDTTEAEVLKDEKGDVIHNLDGSVISNMIGALTSLILEHWCGSETEIADKNEVVLMNLKCHKMSQYGDFHMDWM